MLALQPLVGDGEAGAWLAAGRGLVVAALLAFLWSRYTELRRAAPVPAREWALATAVGIAVFLVWIAFDSGWAVIGGEARGFAPLAPDGSIDWRLAGLRLAGLALVVPLMEELFWRSFLMRWIDARDFLSRDPRQASARAFALCCALFALEHSQWFAGLVAGAAYGWLYIRTANLWIPVLSHAITNGTLGIWILATGNWRFW